MNLICLLFHHKLVHVVDVRDEHHREIRDGNMFSYLVAHAIHQCTRCKTLVVERREIR